MDRMTSEQKQRINEIKILMIETHIKPKQLVSEVGISLSYYYAIMSGNRLGKKPTAQAIKIWEFLMRRVII